MSKDVSTTMSRNLPTFLGVGASRCGTTALYQLLDSHPEVFMARPKELHYFTFHNPTLFPQNAWTLRQYESLFADTPPRDLRGEISPSYLWVPGTAQRIHQALGPIKIVILLRNPVERTISDFFYAWNQGQNRVPFRDFLEAAKPLLTDQQLILAPFHPTAILWKGFYHQQVKSYLEAFGQSNVFIYLFEDMIGNIAAFRKKLSAFLDITDEASLQLQRVNESRKDITIDDDNREILRNIFREDILRLESLIDRDLVAWSG